MCAIAARLRRTVPNDGQHDFGNLSMKGGGWRIQANGRGPYSDGLLIIRNQQVTSSGLVAGSKIPRNPVR
jgi:hypothetical protein